ncbi:AMP-binding protein [Spirillospora sp. CA-294931]|uniref:AMP-binding protein n=1 Tax=Spirillospora sp. CA-294931 TaxID=3240042 RepID=UPI003D8A3551
MEIEAVPAWGTIPRMLRAQASAHPDTEAVVADGTRLTLSGLARDANAVARALIALGVSPGDRVAVWAPNTPRWVVTAFGIWDAGAIVAPLSTRFKGIEARAMLATLDAEVLVVADRALLALLGDARPPHVVVMDGSWTEFIERGAEVSPEAAEERALAVGPDDLGEIMATSGTTGTPKGVMLHHAQLLRGYWDWAEIVTLGPGDRYPVTAPFSHGFGINAGLLACVLRRATMLPIAEFRPDALLDLIERERVSVLAGAPPLFFTILDGLAGRDVSSLRVLICGAAAVPPDLVRRLVERVGLERMINAYGLMEGTVVSMTRPGDPVEVIAGSTGRPVPGVAVRIAGDDGKDVPPGERGEILVGGHGVMRGYWRDPDRTAETVDADGWLHTGDIGTLDDAGNLTIVDRKKEMFIVSGFNAYPAEIEALLLRCPDVAQAAVIGVPDERRGEVGWAYVVPPPGSSPDPDAIVAWARANMSSYKVPRRVILVDALPLNPNGKIDKPALHSRARGAGAS